MKKTVVPHSTETFKQKATAVPAWLLMLTVGRYCLPCYSCLVGGRAGRAGIRGFLPHTLLGRCAFAAASMILLLNLSRWRQEITTMKRCHIYGFARLLASCLAFLTHGMMTG
jgi:hypothetical protein